MRGLILLLAVVLATDAGANPQVSWVCTDEQGHRLTQEQPCATPPGDPAEPSTAAAPAVEEEPPPASAIGAPPPAASVTESPDEAAEPVTAAATDTAAVPHGRALPSTQLPRIEDLQTPEAEDDPPASIPLAPILLTLAAIAFALLGLRGWIASRLNRRADPITTRSRIEPLPRVVATGDIGTDMPSSSRRAPVLFEVQAPAPPPAEWTLELIRRIEWKRFEELCAGYWKAKGYRAESTGCGGTGGVDIRLFGPSHPDRLLGIVQCKSCAGGSIGASAAHEMFGVMHHLKVPLGVVMSSGDFTTETHDFAREKHLKLINGATLLAQIRSLPDNEQRNLLAFVTRDDYVTPSCPQCNVKMVLRESKQVKFWGCPNFPRCSHSLSFQENSPAPA